MKSWADRLGTLRYYQQLGQAYAEMFRTGFTASSFVTAGAAWLGASKGLALLIGLASMFFWLLFAVLCGWVVWRWRVIHATLDADYRNNPGVMRQIAALEEIARNTRGWSRGGSSAS